MGKEKLGQESMFPLADENMRYNIPRGMSQRLFIATMAMQGMISNPNIIRPIDFGDANGYDKFIKVAYSYADELLKQENE